MDIKKVKVSVIVPVYNVELYLHECLTSLVNQTLKDIEIICVNDGSTDNSLNILREYQKNDDRIIIIEQENQGAGVARNSGLNIAKGEYLSFLDPDDFFEITLLEETFNKAVSTKSDIVIYQANSYDDTSNTYFKMTCGIENCLNYNNLPQKEVFSSIDMSDNIFQTFAYVPWNKFFNKNFIEKNHIKFEPMFRSNDFYFVCLSLLKADRISILEKVLVYYRIGMKSNSQATTELYPLNFYQTYLRFYNTLKELGVNEKVFKSFYKTLLNSINYAIEQKKTCESFLLLYKYIVENLDKDFDIVMNEHLFKEFKTYYNYRLMSKNTPDEYLKIKEKYFLDKIDIPLIKVSVIITVYNTDKCLVECLDSVINQTLNEIEIICINDGSTDNSSGILREYTNKDSRISILNQPKQGKSVARNKAISIAKGKYTYFLDSNDMIKPYALEKMFFDMVTNKLDILYFDGKVIYDTMDFKKLNINLPKSRFISNFVLSGAKMFVKMKSMRSYINHTSLIMINTDFLKNAKILFHERIFLEENIFMFKIILIANRVKHIKQELFIKRINITSLLEAPTKKEEFCSYLICYIEMLNYANNFQYTIDVEETVLSTLDFIFNKMFNMYISLPESEINYVEKIIDFNLNTFILIEYDKAHLNIEKHIVTLQQMKLTNLIPIPIVFFYDGCNFFDLMISITSLLENISDSTKYLIYIIKTSNSETQNNITFDNLQNKCKNCKIIYLSIYNKFTEDYVEICKIISTNLPYLERCIYLNYNVIVQKDLRELFEVDLKHFNIGAVRELDSIIEDSNKHNSSVLLINISKIIEQQSNFEITAIDIKYNLSADYLNEEKSFNFGSKIKLNPNLKTIYENQSIKSALTENVIFNYPNNIRPINNSECSFFYEWWKYFRISPLNKISKNSCKNPKVSVIIPVYNVENYISECLDSILNQTLEEIEIICINDGSTDSSLEILQEYAEFDKRIIILKQENQGAGVARNKGLDISTGEYLSFLDPDDFFELTMLEQAYNKAIENDVDIVVYDYMKYSQITNIFSSIQQDFPTEKEVFSYKDIKDKIFITLHDQAWNKLFKSSFIKNNNIRFQHLFRTNDVYFTNISLAYAKKITILNKKLAYYRLGTKVNSQSTLHLYPLSFYEAELALRDKLKEIGVYEEIKQCFLNKVLNDSLDNMHRNKDIEAVKRIYNHIKENLDNDFGITSNSKKYYLPKLYDQFLFIMDSSFEEFFNIKKI